MEHQFLNGFQVRTRHIPAKCQPFLGDPSQSGVESKDRAFCESVETLSKSKAQIEKADIVILAALWRDWAVSQLPQTIANLQLDANQKIVVLGRKSFGKISLRHYLRMTADKRKALRNPINEKFLNANQQMKQYLPAHVFVDQYALICGEGQIRVQLLQGVFCTKKGRLKSRPKIIAKAIILMARPKCRENQGPSSPCPRFCCS